MIFFFCLFQNELPIIGDLRQSIFLCRLGMGVKGPGLYIHFTQLPCLGLKVEEV